ncbi:MAG TPA: hypothetical protein VG758_24990 [Hyphomicrobiaceae bacterium]|jgi:hypothetical protein|nr:hypothetical protein [Hyphomicrobiaceae bacterium]
MTMLARLTTVTLAAVLGSWTASADPIGDLTGYWKGNGSIALTNGKTERVKCNVLYKADGGTQIRQTMRCASSDYTIHSLAELRLKGGQISGTWEEKTYAAKGDVTGRFGGDNIALSIQGSSFSAAMSVSLSSCKQSLNITPQGLEVTRVSINLAKERCGE